MSAARITRREHNRRFLSIATIVVAAAHFTTPACTQPTRAEPTAAMAAPASASSEVSGKDRGADAPPVFDVAIPAGYRDWRLISVAHEEGELDDIRAILGNDIAIEACREGKLPFPDGAIITRIAWRYTPSAENNRVFGRDQSFIAGEPVNGVQFMVKDSKKYASTGGWGYGHFDDGRPADESVLRTCYACHKSIAQERDHVFTRYSR